MFSFDKVVADVFRRKQKGMTHSETPHAFLTVFSPIIFFVQKYIKLKLESEEIERVRWQTEDKMEVDDIQNGKIELQVQIFFFGFLT